MYLISWLMKDVPYICSSGKTSFKVTSEMTTLCFDQTNEHSSWDENTIRSDRRWSVLLLILGSPSVSGTKGEVRRKKNGKERMGIRTNVKGKRRRTEKERHTHFIFKSFSFNFLLHCQSMSNPSTSSRSLAPFPHSLKLKKSSTVTEFRLFFGEEILFWENQNNSSYWISQRIRFTLEFFFFFWRFRKTLRLILRFRHDRKITIMRNQNSMQFVVWLVVPWKTEKSFSIIQFLIFFKTIYESVMSFFFKLHEVHFTDDTMVCKKNITSVVH